MGGTKIGYMKFQQMSGEKRVWLCNRTNNERLHKRMHTRSQSYREHFHCRRHVVDILRPSIVFLYYITIFNKMIKWDKKVEDFGRIDGQPSHLLSRSFTMLLVLALSCTLSSGSGEGSCETDGTCESDGRYRTVDLCSRQRAITEHIFFHSSNTFIT